MSEYQYHRFFPNQDTLPQGGFGNLIALPLQKKQRGSDNSVFLDEEFQPQADQWAFLSSIRRMHLAKIEATLAEATEHEALLGVKHAAFFLAWRFLRAHAVQVCPF